MKIVLVALNSSYTHTNLAVRIFANILSKKHEVVISETTVNDRGGVLSLCEKLYEQKADMYAFSVYIWNREMQLCAASTIKKLLPQSTIVAGGPELSFCDDAFLDQNPYIDFLIRGEGETAIGDIADGKYQSPCIVDGGVFDGFAAASEPYFCSQNPCGCPDGRLFYYESSRGCPFNCSYCLSSVKEKGERVRAKDVETVKKELSVILLHDLRTIKFVDRTFNFDKERAKRIFSYIIDLAESSQTKFPTCHFEICASLLDDETIDILSRAPQGLFRFEIGVQTANPATLCEIGRRDDTKKILENVKKLREKTAVTLHLDLIAGLPYDSYEGIAEAFDLIFPFAHHLQLGILKLLPGTKMCKKASDYGMKYLDTPPYTIIESRDFSFAELRALSGIADTVDDFCDGDAFSGTIEYLVSKFSSPFALFEGLYEYFSCRGQISHREKYAALLDFAKSFLGFDKQSLFVLSEHLRYDFLLSNQGHSPREIERIYTESEGEKLELLRKNFIREMRTQGKDIFVPALESHFFAFDSQNVYFFDRKNRLVFTQKMS